MRLASVVLVTLLVVLAGCADKPKSDPGDDASAGTSTGPSATGSGTTSASGSKTGSASSSHSTSTSASPSPGPGTPANVAPSALLTPSVTAGDAPLVVVFTLDGSDPDGDALSWTLDLDDNGTADVQGTSLPAQVNHTFAAGTHAVNLTVSDGKANAKATVNVTVGAGASGPVQVLDGTYTLAAEGCPSYVYNPAELDPLAPAGGQLDGVVRFQFAVNPVTIGRPYTAAFDFDQGYLYVAANFYDGSAVLLSTDNTDTNANLGDVTLDGTVPVGAARAVLFACGGPMTAKVHYEA